MTRTFLKKNQAKKKRFWSETEVKTESGSAKGDSATNNIHPATNNLPQKEKTRVYATFRSKPACIRGNHRGNRMYMGL